MTDQIKDDEGEFELEIIDDTPEPDKGKPKAEETVVEKPAEDDDLEDYSDKVKKRINKLKYDFHAERRAKEEAARLREEAISVATRFKEENDKLRQSLAVTEDVSIGQAKQRITSQLEQAKAAYKAAYEVGNVDALTDAQMRLSELKAEELRLASFKPQRQQQEQVVPQPKAQPVPQVAQPSQRALTWAKNNAWFGNDEEMTGFAYGVHEKVIKSGVAPDSEEYYNTIDNAVRRVFADKFDDAKPEDKPVRRQASSVVAPAGRQANVTPRKVVMSSSQVAIAKRLGLTNEQYAAQLLKDNANG